MSTYYQTSLRHWDADAEAVYLSIDAAGAANDKFVSYDDEQTAQAKVAYVRNRNIGGLIVWELSGGYRPTQPAGQRDPLLQALRQAAGL
jgi:chitinase